MKRRSLFAVGVLMAAPLLAVALLMPGLVRTAPAEAAIVTQEKVPVDIAVFVPCANGGAGELVLLSGNLHIVITATDDGAGGLHLTTHFQPQGISGVGDVTGDKYQATGVTRDNQNVKPPFPAEYTYVNNFKIIGQGPDNNLLVHENVHLTVNANGEVTADVDNFSVECR